MVRRRSAKEGADGARVPRARPADLSHGCAAPRLEGNRPRAWEDLEVGDIRFRTIVEDGSERDHSDFSLDIVEQTKHLALNDFLEFFEQSPQWSRSGVERDGSLVMPILEVNIQRANPGGILVDQVCGSVSHDLVPR